MSMSFRSPGSDGREREVGLADRGRPLDRLRYVQGAGEERGDVHVLATLLQNPPQPLEGQVPQENLARVQRRSPPVRLPLQHLRKQLLNLFEGLWTVVTEARNAPEQRTCSASPFARWSLAYSEESLRIWRRREKFPVLMRRLE
eukprot:561940-Hanusia_phi.AAC.3